jgi:hypothetical protein
MEEMDILYNLLNYYIYLEYDKLDQSELTRFIEHDLIYKLMCGEDEKIKKAKLVSYYLYANIINSIDCNTNPTIIQSYNNILQNHIINILQK